MKRAGEYALGVEFFRGELSDACTLAHGGGLITAPSGPGLAQDLCNCAEYRRALVQSDLVLPDSGLLCLWKKWVQGFDLPRISGLVFLEAMLNRTDWEKESAFWVMPDEAQAQANISWIQKTYGQKIVDADYYIAPQYKNSGKLIDEDLAAQIEERKPSAVFIQVGGGVQERLGLYLKETLTFSPSIYCTGAALAFLSGQQARIPKWADAIYLGWLLRCLNNPMVFFPRYFKAFRLLALLAKHGNDSPVIED